MPFVLLLILNVNFTAARDELDDAIARVLTEFSQRPNNPIFYREVGRIFDESSGIIYVEPIIKSTEEAIIGVIDWIIALRQNGEWILTTEGDPSYRAAYRQLSQDIINQSDDTRFRPQADPSLVRAENLLDYHLPFEIGEWGTVTRSYDSHGIGKIDFDLTRREIAAAKDGYIIYAVDQHTLNTYLSGAWWYWNVIVIQHGDYEYSLYGHLSPDSIPEWVKGECSDDLSQFNCAVKVMAGEIIAMEGNTGVSTNSHLHVEFGQGFGIVPYLDILDSDQDGLRDEIIYTGYIYAEQNVGMDGFTSEEVAAWSYGTLRQAGQGN
jgi:murein DD-endopeptidase MepM/ murein hydrolase activator NlpD